MNNLNLDRVIAKIAEEISQYQKNSKDDLQIRNVELGIHFSVEGTGNNIVLIPQKTHSVKFQLETPSDESVPKDFETDAFGVLPLPEDDVMQRTGDTIDLDKNELVVGEKEQEVDMMKLMFEDKQLGTVKGYRLLKKIGKGGMSVVCLASSNQTGELYVVKFLTKITKEATSLKRFFQELRVSLRLEHPNITRVYGFDKTPKDIWYLVMEYVKGNSLGNLIRKRGPVPPKASINFTMEIASALDYALQKNVIHRDLKPDNIIIEQNTSTVKVIDFGIGKIMGESKLTLKNELLGTPRYMSPEQLLDTRTVDQRTDIYSLGATLYHMLCGKAPYWEFSGSQAEVIMAIARNKPTPIKSIVKNIPDAVVKVVEKAMERDLEKRYQTPREMLEYMQKIYKLL